MGDAAPEQSDQEVHTRSLFMTKTASMAWLDLQGTAARKFCMTQNVMRKILLPEHATKNEAYISDANNMLRRVHVQRLTVECGTVNNFPFPIGVRISNFPAQEFSSSGEGFSYIIPAKHSIPVSLPIFESHGDETMQATWDQEYSKWTIDNLDTLMAMTVPESDVMLVHLEHPVLQILERRPDYFKVGVQTMTASSTPNWKHVQKIAFEAASKWIKENILTKSSRTFDLSQLDVVFSKIDNSKMTDLPPSCFEDMPFDEIENLEDLNELKANFANVVMQRPFTFSLKIGIQYRIGQV